jgi:hypothetical protein
MCAFCSNGEYHKDYDRQETVESMTRFMLDPKGDAPWEEEPDAKDVIHVEDEAVGAQDIGTQAFAGFPTTHSKVQADTHHVLRALVWPL